jgi:sugar phosphate permease
MRKGIAVVAGMGVDLKLIGDRYSVIVLIFFISYVLLQPPATVVLRKLGPRTFLPSITILWGITMICFGFVKQWYELIPLRIILGIFEAGFFPVCSLRQHPFCATRALTMCNRDVLIFFPAGTLATSSRNVTQYSTSSAA